jgi:hypothetical protein
MKSEAANTIRGQAQRIMPRWSSHLDLNDANKAKNGV